MNIRHALQSIVDHIEFNSRVPAGLIHQAQEALAFGLTVAQEPKYTVEPGSGRIINRATLVAIPDDEPIMIFRAKDVRARLALRTYADSVVETNGRAMNHRNSSFDRYQAFIDFADKHPERMKEPDSQDVPA